MRSSRVRTERPQAVLVDLPVQLEGPLVIPGRVEEVGGILLEGVVERRLVGKMAALEFAQGGAGADFLLFHDDAVGDADAGEFIDEVVCPSRQHILH